MEIKFDVQRLKELRIEKGVTQRELARQTGIAQANISRWEIGIVMPNILDLWRLADFFGVSIDFLCGRSDF